MKLFMVVKSGLVVIGMATFLWNAFEACPDGVVVDRIHIKAYKEEIVSYSITMDAPMIETLNHPEKYFLVIENEDTQCTCRVSKEEFTSSRLGDRVPEKNKMPTPETGS